jgi:hypothetical protein
VTVRAGGPEATAGVAVDQAFGRRVIAGLLAAFVLMTLTACTGGSSSASPSASASSSTGSIASGGASPPTTADPSGSSASGLAASNAILLTYRGFWQALPKAARLKEGPRDELLAQHLINPALKKVAASLASQEAFQRRLYGKNLPRPRVARLDPPTAIVWDCQDSSHAGIRDLKTGERLTVGVERNPVRATLSLDRDGHWRIARIEYPGGAC